MSYEAAAVIREYAPFIWRVLRHLGAPEHQLEDLCQDVLVVIFRRLPEFEGRSALRTWIFGICRNVARSAARQRRRARELPIDPLPSSAIAEAQTKALVQKETHAVLERSLQSLPEPMRMTFALFEIEQLSIAEVAAALGCSTSTAYSRLYAARDRVRAALESCGLIEPGQTIAEVI